jgi:hypothetical protein
MNSLAFCIPYENSGAFQQKNQYGQKNRDPWAAFQGESASAGSFRRCADKTPVSRISRIAVWGCNFGKFCDKNFQC